MKKLVICLDGTWNDDSGNAPLTNVVKLHRAILPEDSGGVRQIAHYVVGIATRFEGRRRFLMGAAGLEVGDRVQTAYRYLMTQYAPGDEIYLFGFSRGAFEARSLASFISMFGIGCDDQGFDVDAAWSHYRRDGHLTLRSKLTKLRAASHYPVRIRCVGVWDTVGNLGNPLLPHGALTRALRYHNTHLPTTIDVGLHALSIDENRGPFSPTLWTLKKGASLAPGQKIEQVWFAGSHADVGGGYAETELSDIALLWMARRTVETTGLAIDLDGLAAETKPNSLGLQHASATGNIFGWTKLLPFVRFIGQDTRPLSPMRRALLGYWRTGKLPADEVTINERLHDSVIDRYGKQVSVMDGSVVGAAVYRPRNLATDTVARAADNHNVATPLETVKA